MMRWILYKYKPDFTQHKDNKNNTETKKLLIEIEMLEKNEEAVKNGQSTVRHRQTTLSTRYRA